jgi:hypothetical protein
MNKRLILSLSAYKQSGKDTLADYLSSAYGFKKISFAAKLKDMVAAQYNVPREFMDSPTHKEMPLTHLPVIHSDLTTESLQRMLSMELRSGYWTPRALCILEGSVKRAVHSNYWVKYAIQEALEDSTQSYVVTDMRYKSEADTINMLFPENRVIRIDRYSDINTNDPSERDMDDYKWNYVIQNKGTKEDLYAQANLLITRLTM